MNADPMEQVIDKDTGKVKRADLLCHKCSTTFSFEVGIKSRPETRGDLVGVTEHGIKCPTCANWTHAYWISVPLERQRLELSRQRIKIGRPRRTQADLIKFNDMRAKYRKAYEKFQKETYKATGVKPTMIREHVVE